MANSNISIRPYEIGDEGAALDAALESVDEVGPFLPWCHRLIVSDDLRRWIEAQVAARNAGTAYEFVIEQADGRFLGGHGRLILHAATAPGRHCDRRYAD